MAVLEIKKYPEKILTKKTEPVKELTDELHQLIDDMIETMYSAPGVGLAANQVGVSKQILVIDVSTEQEESPLIVLINPVVTCTTGESAIEEGCLSVPGYSTIIKRNEGIKVKGLDRKGKPVEIEGT
jgi:peptide deformylase